MKQLEVNKLNFSYDGETDVIKDISFSIERGEYVSIIGHNGSGKSTLAKLIIGLLEAKSGSITVENLELTPETVYEVRDRIAIVFQNPDNQFIGSTVRDDIAFGLENRSMAPEKMDPIIEEYSARVGMADFLDHEPNKLSGGQKQRVAIAGVLAMAPELLILDEATSMLDPKGREEVNELVHDLHDNHNMTILSITHDIEEVINSDRIIILNQGRIDYQGKPQDVLNKQNKMKNVSLDVPFSVKFYDALKRQGIHLSDPFSIEGMVEELWELNSKQ